jgi:glycosyltransferase involved in cell wall biosynthesis
LKAEVFILRDEKGCDNPDEKEYLSFHYLKSLPSWKGRLKLATTLLQCLLLRRPRHLYCGHIKLSPLIRLLCQPLGIPYTILTYGKEVWSTLPQNQRQALVQAESIWTISRYSGDRLCQANSLKPDKVQILPCIVDGAKFTPGAKPQDLINKYQLQNCLVLMTVARLWSGDIYKGVDVTIRALPQILQVFPQVKYLIIGRGDDRPRLEKLAVELGVAERVIFAGFIPTADLVAHYRVADAYIMPSQEGFGIVYLEAMACGKPVLSGDADGSTDPLQDGKLGWQVPHRDPNAVAQACLEILQGQDRRCQGDWLREETLKKFSQAAFTEQLLSLI